MIEKKVCRASRSRAGKQLYTIADLSAVWVDMQLRESDAVPFDVGTAADLEFSGLPGRTLKGRVAVRLSDARQPESRTVRARVAVANAGRRAEAGHVRDGADSRRRPARR